MVHKQVLEWVVIMVVTVAMLASPVVVVVVKTLAVAVAAIPTTPKRCLLALPTLFTHREPTRVIAV